MSTAFFRLQHLPLKSPNQDLSFAEKKNLLQDATRLPNMKTPTLALVPLLLRLATAYTGSMTYYNTGTP